MQGYVVFSVEHADGTGSAAKLAHRAGWLFYQGQGFEVKHSENSLLICMMCIGLCGVLLSRMLMELAVQQSKHTGLTAYSTRAGELKSSIVLMCMMCVGRRGVVCGAC